MLTEINGVSLSRARRSEMRRPMSQASASSVSGRTSANSSPPNRAGVSMARQESRSTSATRHSALLPVRCLQRSLIFLRPSRSSGNTANDRAVRCERSISPRSRSISCWIEAGTSHQVPPSNHRRIEQEIVSVLTEADRAGRRAVGLNRAAGAVNSSECNSPKSRTD